MVPAEWAWLPRSIQIICCFFAFWHILKAHELCSNIYRKLQKMPKNAKKKQILWIKRGGQPNLQCPLCTNFLKCLHENLDTFIWYQSIFEPTFSTIWEVRFMRVAELTWNDTFMLKLLWHNRLKSLLWGIEKQRKLEIAVRHMCVQTPFWHFIAEGK